MKSGNGDFHIDSFENVKDILDKLEKHGLVIHPFFADDKVLTELNEAFDRIQSDEIDSEFLENKGNETVDVQIIRKYHAHKDQSIKKVADFFNQKAFHEIANSFFTGESYHFCGDIFVARDKIGSKHEALDLHFDVRPTLKFFLYLTNTTVENGAFTVVPGSHLQTREIRKKLGNEISYKNRHLSRPDALPESLVPLEFPAGTLIVFTTELFHKAGVVTSGERRIMRSHSWLKKYDSMAARVARNLRLFRNIWK
jgi:hypothetical protein